MEWKPRLVRPGEEQAILRLLLEAHGDWPKAEIHVEPIDHLRWKLEAGRDVRAAVVERSGDIVGAVVLTFRELRVKGSVRMGTSGGDVAVAPAFQGQGVFSSMTPFLLDVNLATADVSYGYRSRNVAVQKALPPMRRGIFGNYVNVLVASTTVAHAGDAPDEPWDLRIVDKFNERANDLWEAAAAQFDFIAGRSQEFLNWRYCDRRGGDFTCLVAEQDGRILGYAVGRISHRRGYLADILALPERLDIVGSLARRVLSELREAGANEVECWLPSRHVYFDTLASLGFSSAKTTQDVTYRPLRTPEADLSFLRQPNTSVHFTAGDTDLV